MIFPLADITIHEQGITQITPPGHCLVTGTGPDGILRFFLYDGPTPTDAGLCGSVVLPTPDQVIAGAPFTAHDPAGTRVSGKSQSPELMLAHLTELAATAAARDTP
ncbi:hypothetical protein [Actinacidiphila paucisporea]|uniref:Uncharacterized protein n=1 Tax=Actinacidiphila paucisporea TaxID=310782 RepID=A0A1M7MFF5_9ACTN|nr:hypothetical protein [Actinacidiphila paucisporea]SHM89133.1 hypothetical protein SAMN05216499_1165 [Actinacidiphila paucisporea]